MQQSLSPVLRGVRVLVVEDDRDSRELLVLTLQILAAHVVGVSNAEDAIRALDRERYDVLISDIGIPVVDGFELVRRLRGREAAEGRGRLPAIALTGFGGDDLEVKARSAGFESCVTKPAEPEELAEAILAVVGKKADRLEAES
jgi:hypothetical protein